MHPISTPYSLKSQCKSHRTIQDSLPLWATTLQPPLPTNKTGNSRTQPPPLPPIHPPHHPPTKAHPLPQPRSRNLPPLHKLHLRHLPNHLPRQSNKYHHSLQHNLHPTLLLHRPLPPHPQWGYSLQHNPPPLLHLRRPHHPQHSHPLRPGRQLRLPHPLLLLRQKLLLP